MHDSLYVFVAAQVAFATLGLLLFYDVCVGPDQFPEGKDQSAFGLEYVSEKLMVCHYAESGWTWLPESIGLAFSIIMIQNIETLRALECATLQPQRPHAPILVLNAVLGTWAWALVVMNDHRRPFPEAPDEFLLHLCGVGLFVFSFLAIHSLLALRYLHYKAICAEYSTARRYSYIAGDSVYLLAVMGFLVLVFVRQVYEAIIIEYVLVFVMILLNVTSLSLLVRTGWTRASAW